MCTGIQLCSHMMIVAQPWYVVATVLHVVECVHGFFCLTSPVLRKLNVSTIVCFCVFKLEYITLPFTILLYHEYITLHCVLPLSLVVQCLESFTYIVGGNQHNNHILYVNVIVMFTFPVLLIVGCHGLCEGFYIHQWQKRASALLLTFFMSKLCLH